MSVKIPEIEDRKVSLFCIDPAKFKRQNQGIEPHQNWSNSATWCMFLYFTQTDRWIKAMRELIRQDGTVNLGRAGRLLNQAQFVSRIEDNIQVDNWCEGIINVPEFVAEFLDSYAGDS